jgi:hypothetical protein
LAAFGLFVSAALRLDYLGCTSFGLSWLHLVLIISAALGFDYLGYIWF